MKKLFYYVGLCAIFVLGWIIGSFAMNTYEAAINVTPRHLRVPQPYHEYCTVYKVDKDHPPTENPNGGFYGDKDYSMTCYTNTPDPDSI